MSEEEITEISEYDTADIQNDLALGLASGESPDEELNAIFIAELRRRDAPLPVNCRWVYNPFAYMKSELKYELEDL